MTVYDFRPGYISKCLIGFNQFKCLVCGYAGDAARSPRFFLRGNRVPIVQEEDKINKAEHRLGIVRDPIRVPFYGFGQFYISGWCLFFFHKRTVFVFGPGRFGSGPVVLFQGHNH